MTVGKIVNFFECVKMIEHHDKSPNKVTVKIDSKKSIKNNGASRMKPNVCHTAEMRVITQTSVRRFKPKSRRSKQMAKMPKIKTGASGPRRPKECQGNNSKKEFVMLV